MHFQYDIACCILISFSIFNLVRGNFQDILRLQHRAVHLPDTKFTFSEYSEYPDNDERDKGSLLPQWNQVPLLNHNGRIAKIPPATIPQTSDALDKNIVWDSHWPQNNIQFGQISAVSIDPNGNIGIFHRGARIWGADTFDNENKFDPNNGPIRENTIVLLDKSGKTILEWGQNMFYLPHGLTIDTLGNYWITDVAMHQVFKFDAKDIEKYMEDLKKGQSQSLNSRVHNYDRNSLFQDSILKPSIILGEAFQPGNDQTRFCKPTAVAVQKNGDFFVSDGYCNSRIIKFNSRGERILTWGRHWGAEDTLYARSPPHNAFVVPHALALADELNYIYVADRENGRVLCFLASNGSFHKEYKHPAFGPEIYSVAYAQEKLYLVNGVYPGTTDIHVRGFVVDIHSGNIVSQFAPQQDMHQPHDLAVSHTGSEIYVVELNVHMVYRFLQEVNISAQTGNSIAHSDPHHEPAPLMDSNFRPTTGGTATATLVLSLVTAAVIFIALCVAIAAIVARCQKRGCLLTMRKKMRWEAERRENFKLSSLLENRRGKGFKFLEKRPNPRDFSKLNTEPETSEDEHPENSLTRII